MPPLDPDVRPSRWLWPLEEAAELWPLEEELSLVLPPEENDVKGENPFMGVALMQCSLLPLSLT